MAWHRHKEKTAKQNKRKNIANVNTKRTLKTITKKLLALIKDKKGAEAKTQLKKAIKAYASSAKRGILHKKTASRHISRLTKKVNALAEAK